MRRRRRRARGFAKGYLAPHRRYRGNQNSFWSNIGSGIKAAGGFLLRLVSLPFVALALLVAPLKKNRRRPAQPAVLAAAGDGPLSAPLPERMAGLRPSKGLRLVDVALIAAILLAGGFLGWSLLYSDTAIAVTVVADGQQTTLLTKQHTAGALLDGLNITLNGADALNTEKAASLEEGMCIEVERAFPVAVSSGGKATVLHMREGSVKQALTMAGVTYDADDEITYLPFADVTPGMQIRHISVETQYETVNQAIPFEEEVIKDASRYIGDDKLKTEGVDGEKMIVRQLVYRDGELSSREVMNQIILKEAVDEVKVVGTKFRAQTNLTGDERPYKAAPKEGEYIEVLTAEDVTAYTHTGRRTSTGKWPKVGYVAVNPNVIPYGTYMYIKGYGYCYAQDTGAFRHEDSGTKNQIDLFMETEKECRKWGRKHNVKVYIIKWGRG